MLEVAEQSEGLNRSIEAGLIVGRPYNGMIMKCNGFSAVVVYSLFIWRNSNYEYGE